jgi:hypothetical protein
MSEMTNCPVVIKKGDTMHERNPGMPLFARFRVIRPWSNNARIGCYWLPYDKDTVEIKATSFCWVAMGYEGKPITTKEIKSNKLRG